MNGNTLTECKCKAGYFGTTCNKCGSLYYDDDGDGTGKEGDVKDNADATNNLVSIQCALCQSYGTETGSEQNEDGNILTSCTCKTGYFKDANNALCDRCSEYYYDDHGEAKTSGNHALVQCTACWETGTENTGADGNSNGKCNDGTMIRMMMIGMASVLMMTIRAMLTPTALYVTMLAYSNSSPP